MRERQEEHEGQTLAPYAAKSRASVGRQYPEAPCPLRTAFQRDRDRVIHSSAFRRLEYKTQVFFNHEGDYYRTRLTHSLEVAQIARGLARTLRLNEDLAEAIALAHDLGHTPFGHAGEWALNRLMQPWGGFEHNRQSLRVVTLLEQRYPEFPGLNLSYEVLEGITKHTTERPEAVTLEAALVDACDEIAYLNHDLDDGLQSGMLSFEMLAEVPLWETIFQEVSDRYPTAPFKLKKHQTIRRLIHQLIVDVEEETNRRLASEQIKTRGDVQKCKTPLIAFSQTTHATTRALKDFLFDHMYRHFRVERMADKAARIVEDLFTTYRKNPKILPTEVYQALQTSDGPERIICDYIAGMTDRFAFDEHKKLFDPHERV